MISRFFQPSRVGTLLLVGILVVQLGVLWRTQTMYALRTDGCRAYTTHRIGLPVVAEINLREQADGSTTRMMRFFRLNAVLMLVGMYCVAMPLAALLRERPRIGVARGFAVETRG